MAITSSQDVGFGDYLKPVLTQPVLSLSLLLLILVCVVVRVSIAVLTHYGPTWGGKTFFLQLPAHHPGKSGQEHKAGIWK